MGYTHYFYTKPSLNQEKWNRFKEDAKKVLEGVDIIQFEYDEPKKPAINSKLIRFNGVGREGHETFLLKRTSKAEPWQTFEQGMVFHFCKTAGKDYDCYVTAILFLAKMHFGKDIKISSDGNVGDWQEGVRILNAALNKNWQMLENPDAEYPSCVETAIIKTGVTVKTS